MMSSAEELPHVEKYINYILLILSHLILHDIMLYHIVLYYIILYYIILYYIISCHVMYFTSLRLRNLWLRFNKNFDYPVQIFHDGSQSWSQTSGNQIDGNCYQDKSTFFSFFFKSEICSF